jgi:hypothetical protein
VQLTVLGDRLAVPRSFFGISMEANEVGAFENGGPGFDHLLSLIRPGDGSRMLLRIGGKSTDDAYWNVTPSNTPPWVFELGDSWMSQFAALVRRERFHVILDTNLAVHSPTMAAAFASAAVRDLPRGALVSLGVGNEPDLYQHQLGLQKERVATTLSSTPLDWAQFYSPSAYRRDYRAYAQALLAAAPGVALDGPDITSSTPSWVTAMNTLTALGPSEITMHRYPFSSCFKVGSQFYPSIPGLLGLGASRGLARRLQRSLAIATSAGRPLRVTELNSISCGGPAGVADSFATALWAPDALFELMHAGVIGVNWHIRPALRNAPFHFVPGGIEPLPELYGLIAFSQMIRPGAQLESIKLVNPTLLNLRAWAVRSRDGLKVMLIDKSPAPATIALNATGLTGQAHLIRLKAPSITSRTGISLGGQSVGADGRLHGHLISESVRQSHGVYRLRVRPYSADLVSFAR